MFGYCRNTSLLQAAAGYGPIGYEGLILAAELRSNKISPHMCYLSTLSRLMALGLVVNSFWYIKHQGWNLLVKPNIEDDCVPQLNPEGGLVYPIKIRSGALEYSAYRSTWQH